MSNLAPTQAGIESRQRFVGSPGLVDNEQGHGHVGGITLNGTYRLLEPVGHGGMSVVYAAEHLRLGHRVAVKLLSTAVVADRYCLGRFRREAELLSRLHHPHILQVIDFDTADNGQPYLVTELLEGEPLDQRLRRRGSLPLAEVVEIVSQIASALAYAHERSIIHRDLKPANIYLGRVPGQRTFAKLLDFGISKSLIDPKLTCEFALVGTPQYMAPEQAFGRAAEVDQRADQYALALVAYEALSGQHPFAYESAIEVLEAVRKREAPALSRIMASLPEEISAVIARAMSKDPSARYDDVSEFARALECAAEEPASSEVRPSTLSVDATEELADQTRAALERGDLDAACRLARAGVNAYAQARDPRTRALLEVALPLFEHIFVIKSGGLGQLVCARPDAPGCCLTPTEAFVLSRTEDPLSIDELIDVAGLPRVETLGIVVRLLDDGVMAAI